MAKAIVNSVTHNVQKTSAAGKSYTVSVLSYTTEKGQTKKTDIFSNATYFKTVRDLTQGDEIDVKMVQNGNYWNVSDIVKLSSLAGSSSKQPSSAPVPARAPFVEDKERQASIQRQNALTNATNLVSQMLSSELFKKTTKPNVLVEEIIKIASAFEGYTSGRDVPSKLEAKKADTPTKDSDIEDVLGKDDEVPF